MHSLSVCVCGLALGGLVGACGAWGTVQKASEVAFTAAEAQCLLLHANQGPHGAQASCSIEEERAPGVQVVVLPGLCSPVDAGK